MRNLRTITNSSVNGTAMTVFRASADRPVAKASSIRSSMFISVKIGDYCSISVAYGGSKHLQAFLGLVAGGEGVSCLEITSWIPRLRKSIAYPRCWHKRCPIAYRVKLVRHLERCRENVVDVKKSFHQLECFLEVIRYIINFSDHHR